MTNYVNEIQRRRTFAIISHPDAGKTTLTEKLLLYGGAILSAGSVKAVSYTHLDVYKRQMLIPLTMLEQM